MSDGPRPAVTLDCRVADILRIPQVKVTVLLLELDSISLFLEMSSKQFTFTFSDFSLLQTSMAHPPQPFRHLPSPFWYSIRQARLNCVPLSSRNV